MSLQAGTRLGSYELVSRVGSGGMGVVYQARDPRLDRLVAIKVLPSDLTRDDNAKQRFLLEAKAASALDHPNICTIHEINETPDGQLYLVMAYYGAGARAGGRSSQRPLVARGGPLRNADRNAAVRRRQPAVDLARDSGR
jgi:serine/threonine protein kinase